MQGTTALKRNAKVGGGGRSARRIGRGAPAPTRATRTRDRGLPPQSRKRGGRGGLKPMGAGGGDGAGASPSPQDQEKLEKMKEEYEKTMKDPKVRAQVEGMQQMMQDPKVQEQMKQATSTFQDPAFKAKIESLRDDPEFKEMFDELKKGGMGALMKFWNDPVMLKKMGEKLGPGGAGGAPGAPSAPEEAPIADNLLDAARYGDLEATEDYIAIGRDVNESDKDSRTPLHFAAGGGHLEIALALVDAGATVDAKDSKLNTPLHYATGYGRGNIANLLVSKGSQVGLQNANGKKAVDMAKLNPENPILKDEELMKKLSKSTFVDT